MRVFIFAFNYSRKLDISIKMILRDAVDRLYVSRPFNLIFREIQFTKKCNEAFRDTLSFPSKSVH